MALIAVLVTQSGCVELLLLALNTTAAVGFTQAAIRQSEERERKEKEEAEAGDSGKRQFSND